MGQRTTDTPRSIWDIPIVLGVVIVVCVGVLIWIGPVA